MKWANLSAYSGPHQPDQQVIAVPGSGTEVPIWLLGSSLFSARLAAEHGVPYAFASHFAPAMLLQAIALYRHNFRPSATLAQPYVMIGVPVIAAPTDDEAEYLASSTRISASSASCTANANCFAATGGRFPAWPAPAGTGGYRGFPWRSRDRWAGFSAHERPAGAKAGHRCG